MTKLRYKEYEWPHNPSDIQIRWENRIEEHILPYVGSMLEGVGRKYRVITGEGDFYGKDCYERFSQLSRVFEEGGSGYLCLPGMSPFRAMFRALEMRCGAGENLIHYRFEFWEEIIQSVRSMEESGYHVVGQGETLWSVAALYGHSVDELLALNPQIRSTLALMPGEQVKVR